jgi:hypothetical protein
MVEAINERFNRLPEWAKWMAIPTYFVIGVFIVALYPFYIIFKAIQGVRHG